MYLICNNDDLNLFIFFPPSRKTVSVHLFYDPCGGLKLETKPLIINVMTYWARNKARERKGREKVRLKEKRSE